MNRDKDIYILLTDTGTVLTKIIRSFTKDPLNHASIAFDADLNEVYSFGRKNPSNPFIAGFVREDVRNTFFEDSMCAIYRIRVGYNTYNSIRAEIQHFMRNQEKYRYNLIGMLGVVFNVEWERKNRYFCSQFVTTVFARSGVNLVSKSPLLVTPGDLQKTSVMELVYHGRLHAYAGCDQLSSSTSSFRTA
ncbi:hypothetical protein M6D81_24115 [Paenibacillus sp. J5C_2022]|uniref:hypothetical protein n=1 Tax=Paenibacillus sp. J5C2022 TaxID=2977129 RepID=UPI0021D26E01|nr:hypothetical protein [Paenibacillus sp. J5C2022]MCU6711790.1 hypothetical protein [Paenibacillus sp. J5C2022]